MRLRGNTPNLLNLLVRTIVGSCRIAITMPQFSSEDEDCGIFMQETVSGLAELFRKRGEFYEKSAYDCRFGLFGRRRCAG